MPDGEPNLVNGIVLMDEDGVIWLCEALAESVAAILRRAASPGPQLSGGNRGDWDISTGELIGLQEDGGVLWREVEQYFGVVEP